MMTKGGHKVQAGTYWNMANGERVDLDQEGVLPGSGNDMYIKAPAAMAIAAGLSAGLFEELGWTGFAIPRLRRSGIVATGLMVGVL